VHFETGPESKTGDMLKGKTLIHEMENILQAARSRKK
jgi:hypothetical protein